MQRKVVVVVVVVEVVVVVVVEVVVEGMQRSMAAAGVWGGVEGAVRVWPEEAAHSKLVSAIERGCGHRRAAVRAGLVGSWAQLSPAMSPASLIHLTALHLPQPSSTHIAPST